jgi:hypothetical protein
LDQKSIRTQLTPGWTLLNILIMVTLFIFVWWPFGLLMLAYILFGAKFGLNLAEPTTFKEAFARLTGGTSVNSGSATRWNADRSGTDSPGSESANTTDLRDEAERLCQEREKLDRERADFDAEKQSHDQQRREDA